MSDEEEMNTMLYDPYGHYKPSNLLHKNTVPGDRFFPGGWAGKIYQLWLIVVPLILGFSLWWYILQWQFLVTVILTGIEGGIVLVLFVAATVLSVWADADEIRLVADGAGETSYRRLIDAKRSRVNASVDVSILFSALLIMIFEFAMVYLYAYGGTSQSWLNGVTATVNYPLTNTTAYPTITGKVINQVSRREWIHFFSFIKAVILLVGVLFTRSTGQALHVTCSQLEKARLKPKGEGIAETASRLATPPKMNSAKPLGGQLVYTQ